MLLILYFDIGFDWEQVIWKIFYMINSYFQLFYESSFRIIAKTPSTLGLQGMSPLRPIVATPPTVLNVVRVVIFGLASRMTVRRQRANPGRMIRAMSPTRAVHRFFHSSHAPEMFSIKNARKPCDVASVLGYGATRSVYPHGYVFEQCSRAMRVETIV